MRFCPSCGKQVEGRTDKKFCSPYCKSAYHYEQNRDNENNLFKKIDDQLKLNRRLLKQYNKAGKATVRKEVLIGEGFDPKYFTHYWKTKTKNIYLFCYEYGFMEKTENGKIKYVLIQWQAYMN
ncbi:MAG: hypothetical protein AAFN93_10355 [Bacteroidota bacterium]